MPYFYISYYKTLLSNIASYSPMRHDELLEWLHNTKSTDLENSWLVILNCINCEMSDITKLIVRLPGYLQSYRVIIRFRNIVSKILNTDFINIFYCQGLKRQIPRTISHYNMSYAYYCKEVSLFVKDDKYNIIKYILYRAKYTKN